MLQEVWIKCGENHEHALLFWDTVHWRMRHVRCFIAGGIRWLQYMHLQGLTALIVGLRVLVQSVAPSFDGSILLREPLTKASLLVTLDLGFAHFVSPFWLFWNGKFNSYISG